MGDLALRIVGDSTRGSIPPSQDAEWARSSPYAANPYATAPARRRRHLSPKRCTRLSAMTLSCTSSDIRRQAMPYRSLFAHDLHIAVTRGGDFTGKLVEHQSNHPIAKQHRLPLVTNRDGGTILFVRQPVKDRKKSRGQRGIHLPRRTEGHRPRRHNTASVFALRLKPNAAHDG